MEIPEATPKDHREYRLEKYLLRAATRRLEDLGAVVTHIHGERYQQYAVDLLICLTGGRFCAIELKVGKNKPTQRQSEYLRRVQMTGGIAGVAWTVADCLEIITGVENHAV